MHDPVVVSDGHTYERRHIERWLQEHTSSPVSNEELPQKAVFPNHALRNAISEYFDQVFSVHRRAIRKSIRGQEEQQRVDSNDALVHTIDALMQCSFLMNADLNTECVLRQIMDEAKTLVGADAASVFLVDSAKQELFSHVNSTGAEICIPITTGIAGRVATSGEPLIINDAYADERFNRSNDLKTGFRTHSILCVPLKLKRGAVIGVVQLINKTRRGVFTRSQAFGAIPEETPVTPGGSARSHFTAQDLQFVQVFASQAATAVANSGGVLREPQFDEEPTDMDAHDSDTGDTKKCGVTDMPLAAVEDDEQPMTCMASAASTSAPEDDEQPMTCMSSVASTSAPAEETGELSMTTSLLMASTIAPAKEASIAATDTKEPIHCPKVALILEEAFHGWEFDALSLAELTENKPLTTLGMYLFERLGFVQHFHLDCDKLKNFFVCIESGYDDANPYHNRAHAASVMHALHALLEHGGIGNAVTPSLKSPNDGDGKLQRMACLFAAAVHDHEHLGQTNEFLVRTSHPRAMLYNDQHVNENHHVTSAFAVLRRPECNFLACLPQADFCQLRNMVIELVLGTDMANGSKIQKSFNDTFGAVAEGYSPSPPALASAKDAVLLLQMAMKCADLGHLALSWDVHVKWVVRLEEEFFAQGDKEKGAGLPVSFLMDRNQPGCSKTQVGFFQNVPLPLLRALVQVAPLAKPMLDQATANCLSWQELDGVRSCISPARSEQSRVPQTYPTTVPMTSVASTQIDIPVKKKSGRARQRAAKFWATTRCRTPSPEPLLSRMAQRC